MSFLMSLEKDSNLHNNATSSLQSSGYTRGERDQLRHTTHIQTVTPYFKPTSTAPHGVRPESLSMRDPPQKPGSSVEIKFKQLLASDYFKPYSQQQQTGEVSGQSTALNSQNVTPYVSVKSNTRHQHSNINYITQTATDLDMLPGVGILRAENQGLKLQIERLQMLVRNANTDKGQKDQVRVLQQEKTSTTLFYQGQLEALSSTCAQLRSELLDRDQLIRELGFKLAQTDSEKSMVCEKYELVRLQNEKSVAAVSMEVESWKSQQAKLREENKKLEQIVANCRNAAQKAQAESDHLRDLNQKLGEELNRSKTVLEQERIRLRSESAKTTNQLEASVQQLENRCGLLVLEIQRLTHQKEDSLMNLRALEAKFQSDQETLARNYHTQLEETRRQLKNQTEQQISMMVRNHQMQLEEIRRQLNKEAQQQISSVTRTLQTQMQQACRQVKSESEQQFSTKLQLVNQHTQFRMEDYNRKLLEQKDTIKQLEQTLRGYAIEIQGLGLRFQEKELLLLKEKQAVQESSEIARQLRHQSQTLQKKVTEEQAKSQKHRILLQKEQSQHEQNIQHFKKQLQRLNEALNDEKVSRRRVESRLEQQIADKQQRISVLSSEANLRQGELQRTRNELLMATVQLKDHKSSREEQYFRNQRLALYRTHSPLFQGPTPQNQTQEIRLLEKLFLKFQSSHTLIEEAQRQRNLLNDRLLVLAKQCRSNEELILKMQQTHTDQIQKLGKKFEAEYAQLLVKCEKYKRVLDRERLKKQAQRNIIKESDEFGQEIMRKCRAIVQDTV